MPFENGKQRRDFRDALLSAFPRKIDLDQMLSFELDENLDEIATGDNNSDVIFKVIKWAESQGRLEELIKAASKNNPGNQKLKEFCQQYSLSACSSTSRSQIIEKSHVPLSQPAPKPPQEQPQPKPTTQIIPEDDLSSEKGVDYKRLRDLLKAGKWKEADEETLTVMLKAAGGEKEGYLGYQDIQKFPCTDLRTIDQLWVKYSNGHFGFSVQKRIWLEYAGKIDYKTEKALGDAVGWRKKGDWIINYEDVTFSLDAPLGHLPCYVRMAVDLGSRYYCYCFFSRVETCKM